MDGKNGIFFGKLKEQKEMYLNIECSQAFMCFLRMF